MSRDWQTYEGSLTEYNKIIRNSKRNSWKNFCESIKDISPTARLIKLMSKDKQCNFNVIKLPNGKYTTSGKETLAEMLRINFPGSVATSDNILCNLSTHA